MQNYNPSNKHNNLGKKIIIGGLAAIVLTGSAIAYTQFAPNDEISPTPYNPPAITTPAENTTETPVITPTPTENQTPAETPISLEEKLADRLAPKGPLSDTQISDYTLNAYDLAYEAIKMDDDEMYELAKKSLGRVITDVVNSIFKDKELGRDSPGYEKLLALYQTSHEYLVDKDLSGEDLVDFEDYVKNESNRWSEKRDKEYVIKQLRRTFGNNLGRPRGGLS